MSRLPKTTQQAINEGDPRKIGKRKLLAKLAAEPKASRGLPECPAHLTGLARKAWEFWASELVVMNQDHRPDAMMLEGACVMYARARQADLTVERDGSTFEESVIDKRSGEKIVLKIKRHPAVEVSNTAWRQCRAFCGEFGLSPVARTRLAIENPDKGEDLLAILSAPRKPRAEVVQ